MIVRFVVILVKVGFFVFIVMFKECLNVGFCCERVKLFLFVVVVMWFCFGKVF